MAAIRRINPPGSFAKIGLNLPIELRDWLQLYAATKRTTASAVVAESLEAYRARVERRSAKK